MLNLNALRQMLLKYGLNGHAASPPAITIPLEVDFIAVSSYREEDKQVVGVRLEKDLSRLITGSHLFCVEDYSIFPPTT